MVDEIQIFQIDHSGWC